MRRSAKLLAAAAGTLALTALLVLAVLPAAIDSNLVRARMLALIAAHTGVDVQIDGRVHLRWLPTPRITATNVRLANPPGFSSQDLLHVGSLSLAAAPVTLLRGRFEVDYLEVDDMVVEVEHDAEGNSNWMTAVRAVGVDDTALAKHDGAPPSPFVAPIVLGGLSLRDARVVWHRSHEASTVAAFEARTGAIDFSRNIENVHVRASILGDAGARLAVLEAHGSLADGRLDVDALRANAASADAEMSLEGAVRGQLQSGRLVLEEVTAEGTIGRRRQAFRLDASGLVDVAARTLTMSTLRVRLADTRVDGDLALTTDSVLSHITGEFGLRVEDHPIRGSLAADWSGPALEVALELRDVDAGDAPRRGNDFAVRARIDSNPAGHGYRIRDAQVIADIVDPGAPDGRLHLDLGADVDIDTAREHVLAHGLRLRMHDTVIAGHVELTGFQSPSVRFDLDADAVDADRMLPLVGARTGAGAKPVRATFEAIRGMDLAGEMRVGRLAVGDMRFLNVRIRAGDRPGG